MEYGILAQNLARSMRSQGCLECATGDGKWAENEDGQTKVTFIIVFYPLDGTVVYCGIKLDSGLNAKNIIGTLDSTDAWEKFQNQHKITLRPRQSIDEIIMD